MITADVDDDDAVDDNDDGDEVIMLRFSGSILLCVCVAYIASVQSNEDMAIDGAQQLLTASNPTPTHRR